MNRRGQNLVFALITASMVFIVGMLTMNHLMSDVTITKTVGLDCTSTDISDGTKVTCLGVDLVIPTLIVAIVSLAVGAILARFIV